MGYERHLCTQRRDVHDVHAEVERLLSAAVQRHANHFARAYHYIRPVQRTQAKAKGRAGWALGGMMLTVKSLYFVTDEAQA